jgi:hypothetical protein
VDRLDVQQHAGLLTAVIGKVECGKDRRTVLSQRRVHSSASQFEAASRQIVAIGQLATETAAQRIVYQLVEYATELGSDGVVRLTARQQVRNVELVSRCTPRLRRRSLTVFQ